MDKDTIKRRVFSDTFRGHRYDPACGCMDCCEDERYMAAAVNEETRRAKSILLNVKGARVCGKG